MATGGDLGLWTSISATWTHCI